MTSKQDQIFSLFRFYDIKESPISPDKFPEFIVTPGGTSPEASKTRGPFLQRGKLFSVFKEAHAKEAATLYNFLINLESYDDFILACEELKKQRNEGLYLYALTVALLNRPDTAKVDIPPLWELNPHAYFTTPAIYRAKFQAEQNEAKLDDTQDTIPAPLIVPIFKTGTYLDPEQKVAWWREDIGLNAHHFHWHQVSQSARIAWQPFLLVVTSKNIEMGGHFYSL